MDDLLNREYNGWENRFTWLVHLHVLAGVGLARLGAVLYRVECSGRIAHQWGSGLQCVHDDAQPVYSAVAILARSHEQIVEGHVQCLRGG